ncbi:AMP-binding protein [Streptomyces sp. ISL-86]|uniref:AMP-binding protein n=1 Tax=Streptomyces sp. ISL-86 TaxID=2819187 RepID=UPI001BE4FB47|nr:AMP-binding protein [Streptomyces sp. ISL-86]MBT2458715.1 AMP-binding protein [Streptomyces sp. ISL-86]
MTQGSESAHTGRLTADTVLHRFEQCARDTPEARAVIAGPDSLTYGQLDARANQLARHLIDAGLPAGGLVAIGAARQTEIVIALLAALKAGGAYAVIDVEAPGTGRRQLARISPYVLLTHAAGHARLDDGSGLRAIRLGAEAAEIAARPTTPPAGTVPGPTAAVLFTGGAEPRPVPVSRQRLLAAHDAWAEVARLTPEDRHLITAGPDVTGFAAGWTRALCSGAALAVPERSPWTPRAIRRAVEDEQVTVVHTDPAGAARLLIRDDTAPHAQAPRPNASRPSALGQADSALRSLRMVTVTGDRLFLDEQAALQARLRPGARLLNVYGPTEAAGTGTWFELPQLPGPLDDPEQLSLLGTPFPGCRVDLRDGEIRLTPPDGGDPIPTGDLAGLRPDGLLEFGGRIRDRITLDGQRLDPHRLESVIRGHQDVGSVIVAEVQGGGGRGGSVRPGRLVAYLAPPPDAPAWPPGADLPDIEKLRDHLAGRLLFEETPRAVIRLRTLPRNRAGQENRTALPQPTLLGKPDAQAVRAAKYAPSAGGGLADAWVGGCAALVLAFAGLVLLVLAKGIWPGSTDLTGVPSPWAFLFFVLYLFEGAAFATGLLFLLGGRPMMRRQGRGRALTTAAHLAVVYLLVAWWPQDNFYRLAAKQDWPRQAALVYAFNIPLMIAAGIVAFYVSQAPASASAFDFDD